MLKKPLPQSKLERWKVISSKMVLDTPWYKVQEEEVEIKPGKRIQYSVSLWHDIVFIVALTKDQEIVLVRQYKHGPQEIMLDTPAGYIDKGEDPLAAAKRELAEETGYTSDKWQKIGFFHQNTAKERGNNIHVFLVQEVTQSNPQELDETENIEVITRPFTEAKELIKSGKINSTGSAISIFLAQDYI